MAKDKTPTYTLERELLVDSHETKIIKRNMEIGRQIYNAVLGEALKRLHKVQADPAYRETVRSIQALKETKTRDEEKEKSRLSKLAKDIERSYGYSEFQMHTYATDIRRHFGSQLDANEVQKLATRAFKAVGKLHYHKADKVHFKKAGEYPSIENKSNKQGLRWKKGRVVWGKLSMELCRIRKKDDYAWAAMDEIEKGNLKYLRIVSKVIRGKERFFVQFVIKGVPPENGHKQNPGSVGLDIGPSTVAIVTNSHAELRELAEGITSDAKELRRIERAMDRSKRATNPDNYNKNGTPKKGRRQWNYSKRYSKLKTKRKEINRQIAAKRKQSHEILANKILALGDNIKVETMRFQGLQKRAKKTTRNRKNGKINKKKRFGKSIANHAPAMFLTILERKLAYKNKALHQADTFTMKASQFNHITGEYQKKLLSDRWNDLGGHKIQRDLYSAFLINNANPDLATINVSACEEQWQSFVILHDAEIQRIRTNGPKTLKHQIA